MFHFIIFYRCETKVHLGIVEYEPGFAYHVWPAAGGIKKERLEQGDTLAWDSENWPEKELYVEIVL